MSIISQRHVPDGWKQTVRVDADGRVRTLAALTDDTARDTRDVLRDLRLEPDDPWSPALGRDGDLWAVFVPEALGEDEPAPVPFAPHLLPSARFRLLSRHRTREDARSAARDWMAGLGADSV